MYSEQQAAVPKNRGRKVYTLSETELQSLERATSRAIYCVQHHLGDIQYQARVNPDHSPLPVAQIHSMLLALSELQSFCAGLCLALSRRCNWQAPQSDLITIVDGAVSLPEQDDDEFKFRQLDNLTGIIRYYVNVYRGDENFEQQCATFPAGCDPEFIAEQQAALKHVFSKMTW